MAWQRYKDICKSFIELYFIEKLTFLDKKITLNEAFKTHQRVASQPNRTEPIRTNRHFYQFRCTEFNQK